MSVKYSQVVAYGSMYFMACHSVSSLVLNILRVVADTVTSESLFLSWTICWLKVLHRSSNKFCIMDIMSSCTMLLCHPEENLRFNLILNTIFKVRSYQHCVHVKTRKSDLYHTQNPAGLVDCMRHMLLEFESVINKHSKVFLY